MGCGQSRDVLTPTSQLGSHGSSAEEDEGIVKRTWGSPAPILPSICKEKFGEGTFGEDEPFAVPPHKGTRGVAFFVGDDNNRPTKLPPRRLQTLNANRLSMDDLLRKQTEAEIRHARYLQQKMKPSEDHKTKRRANEKKDFDKAMSQYTEIEKKLVRGDEKRKSIIKQKVEKSKLHLAKVSEVRRKSISTDPDGLNVSGKIEADTEYNRSESGSWDNESIKNIYDQMEYITPVSGLTRNTITTGHDSDEDFFS